MNRSASKRTAVKGIHSLGKKGHLVFLILTLVIADYGTSNAATDTDPQFVPGNAKTWVEDGRYTIQTVLSGTVEVNGIQTTVIEETGGNYPGRRFYYSIDATGYYHHRTFVPNAYLEGVGFADTTGTYSPPVLLSPPILSIGQTINGKSGLVVQVVTKTQGTASFVYTFEYSYTLVGFENVTVPLGNFDALKVTSTEKIYGTNYGKSESSTRTGTNWTVHGIGSIKSITTSSDGETRTRELVSINFGHPPVAYAGSDRTVPEKSTVTLDASGSTDADGDIVSYQWTQVSGPEVTLTNPSSMKATFKAPTMADSDEPLTFELTVMDNLSFKSLDTITITLRKRTTLPFLMLLLED